MGLLDILNGMQNGPRGQTDPNRSGGMSPLTMGLIALLAYKAYGKLTAPQPNAAPAASGGQQRTALGGAQQQTASGGAPSGGLGDLLQGGLGGLGGLLAGGAAGSILSGGLDSLIKQFDQTGHGDVAKSWVGTGQNKDISPNELEHALGDDTLNSLAEQAGLSKVEVLQHLSRQLPGAIDQMTPQGRVPTEDEMSRMV
ncbi:MAG TPA: YidB family protein [Pseudolabrys sp.]